MYYRSRNVASGDVLSYYSEDELPSVSIDFVKAQLNQSVLKPRFRIHWLNEDETVKMILPEEDIISGYYNENYQNGQRRSLSITLFNEDGRYKPSINGIWANVKFSFEM